MRMYELIPIDNRKSFYGKARVIVTDDGAETLYSYNTPVIRRVVDEDGTHYYRLWNGWSATTGRHIASYCGLNKAGYMELPEA